MWEIDEVETGEFLVEALLAHDHVDEALERLLSLLKKWPQGGRSEQLIDRLIDLLIKHSRVDEAIELLLRAEVPYDRQTRWANFVDRMTVRGRDEEIIQLLHRLVGSDDPAAFSLQPTIQKLLADQPADRDRWAEVLELLKDAGGWAQDWLTTQLGRLGKADHLRHLANNGNRQARVELVNLMLNQDRPDEAAAVLRTVVDVPNPRARDYWAVRKLAEILAERGNFTELRTRVVAGDKDAAQVLVEYAYRGWLPDAEQFLATGLAPDGSLDSP